MCLNVYPYIYLNQSEYLLDSSTDSFQFSLPPWDIFRDLPEMYSLNLLLLQADVCWEKFCLAQSHSPDNRHVLKYIAFTFNTFSHKGAEGCIYACRKNV